MKNLKKGATTLLVVAAPAAYAILTMAPVNWR